MIRIAILACLFGSAASSPWSDYLASTGGNYNNFDWKTGCQKLGQQPAGYGMSMGGGKTTIKLTCDNNHINVVCDGSTCSSSYKPPASAADTPPPGKYAKTATHASCGGFSAKEVQAFLDIHNKMRCAVGVPPVEWDGDLECQAQSTQNQIGGFSHSHSYDMDISAGENLATGKDVANAAWMWFTEYLQSGGNYAAGGHSIGHYSAMSWKSVKTIGCGIGTNGKGTIRCMYSGGSKSAAPNMQGGYADNLTPFKGAPGDFKKCGLTAAEVKAKASMYKKWGILSPGGNEAANIGMYSVAEVETDSMLPTAFLPACAFFGALAMVTVGVVMRRRARIPAIQDETELLAVEEAGSLD